MPPPEEVDEDVDAHAEEMLRVRLPADTARAFAKRTRDVVDAGRPTNVIGGQQMDADGHTCTFPES